MISTCILLLYSHDTVRNNLGNLTNHETSSTCPSLLHLDAVRGVRCCQPGKSGMSTAYAGF